MFDVEKTIISQYANSPVLVALIKNFNAYIDPTVNFDAFYNLIWNVDTAADYGLDVWGRIVGVNRILHVEATKFWGFSEATSQSADPFGQSPFYSDGAAITSNYRLNTVEYRTLIFAKALANISDGSIASINQILLNLFGDGYVIDNRNMSMTYAFRNPGTFTTLVAAIVYQSGVLPRPSGVTLLIQGATPPIGTPVAVWDQFAWDDGSVWA